MDQEVSRTDPGKMAAKKKRRVLIYGFAALGVAAIAIGLLLILNHKPDLAASSVRLPFSSKDSYAVCDTGLYYYKDGAVHALNTSGQEIWYKDLAGENMKLSASASLLAAYTPSTLHVFDQKGKELFTREFLGTVRSVACSDSLVCVCRKGAQGSDLSVIKSDGTDLNTIDLGTQDTVAFGVDDATKNIWMLTVDTSATTLISRLSIYSGDGTIRGLVTADTHLVKGALLTSSEVFMMGSTHVSDYDYKGELLSSQLVYGWNVRDARVAANGKPLLILTPPAKEGANAFAYPMARLIAYGVSESLLSLPPECFQVLLGDNKIYCFTPKAVHVYNLNGREEDSYPLGTEIDGVGTLFDNAHILAFSGQESYLIPLP